MDSNDGWFDVDQQGMFVRSDFFSVILLRFLYYIAEPFLCLFIKLQKMLWNCQSNSRKQKKNSIDYFKCMSLMRIYPLGASLHYLVPEGIRISYRD